jgi:hypothetical protein
MLSRSGRKQRSFQVLIIFCSFLEGSGANVFLV